MARSCFPKQIGAAVLLGGLVAGSAAATVRGDQLPSLGNPSSQALSPAKANRIGIQVIGRLRERNVLMDDAQLEDYVNDIGNRLVAHAQSNDQRFNFYVVERRAINAFALPGGYVGVDSGLIAATDTESELAAVMAHEIAHVSQHHIARQQMESEGTSWTTLAGVLVAAIAGASTGNGDAVPAAISGGLAHMMQQQASFTRAHEYEADRVGLRTLAAANFNPDAMARFFGKIERQNRLYDNRLPPSYLSHPRTAARIAEAASRAADYPKKPRHTNPVYPLMRERARVLQTTQLDPLKDHYRSQRTNGARNPAVDYGYALTLIRLGEPKQAMQVLRAHAKAHPEQLPWQLALAKAEADAGQSRAALARLQRAQHRFGNSPAAKLAYAAALLATDQPLAARDFLISQDRLLSVQPDAQRLLAEAASRRNELGEAYYRRARYFAMHRQYAQAINQISAGLQTTKLDADDRARLTAFRRQVALTCNRTFGTRECAQAVKKGAKPATAG